MGKTRNGGTEQARFAREFLVLCRRQSILLQSAVPDVNISRYGRERVYLLLLAINKAAAMLDGPLPTRPRQLAVITVAAAGALVSLLSYTTLLCSLTLTYGRGFATVFVCQPGTLFSGIRI